MIKIFQNLQNNLETSQMTNDSKTSNIIEILLKSKNYQNEKYTSKIIKMMKIPETSKMRMICLKNFESRTKTTFKCHLEVSSVCNFAYGCVILIDSFY